MRPKPFSERKARPAKLLAGKPGGIVINGHVEADGAALFAAACKMGLEGIVLKRTEAPYRSGRSRYWTKTKNPDRPAERRAQDGRW